MPYTGLMSVAFPALQCFIVYIQYILYTNTLYTHVLYTYPLYAHILSAYLQNSCAIPVDQSHGSCNTPSNHVYVEVPDARNSRILPSSYLRSHFQFPALSHGSAGQSLLS